MIAYRLGALLVAISVLVSGCVLGGSDGPLPDEEPRLFMGGVHIRWDGDNAVEAEGYLFNPGPGAVSFPNFIVSGMLAGSERHLTRDQTILSGSDWAPGEARKWAARFQDVPREPYRLAVNVHEPHSWSYITPCLDPSLQPVDACPAPAGIPRLTPETEREEWPRLLECCSWRPPPFDAYDLDCRLVAADVQCSAIVWNFDNATATALGELVLHSTDPASGRVQEAGKQKVDLGGAYEAGEAREVQLTMSAAAAQFALTPGHTLEGELRVALADVPRTIANETTLLTVAGVGE